MLFIPWILGIAVSLSCYGICRTITTPSDEPTTCHPILHHKPCSDRITVHHGRQGERHPLLQGHIPPSFYDEQDL